VKERAFIADAREAKGLHDGSISRIVRVVPAYQVPKTTDSDDAGMRWMAVAQHHSRYGFSVFGPTEAECAEELEVYGKNPFGGRGHRLWVREALHNEDGDWHYCGSPSPRWVDITEEWERKWASKGYIPAIAMPRVASRTLLDVTDVRVIPVQKIIEEDAVACGVVIVTDRIVKPHSLPIEYIELTWRDYFAHMIGQAVWDANAWIFLGTVVKKEV